MKARETLPTDQLQACESAGEREIRLKGPFSQAGKLLGVLILTLQEPRECFKQTEPEIEYVPLKRHLVGTRCRVCSDQAEPGAHRVPF